MKKIDMRNVAFLLNGSSRKNLSGIRLGSRDPGYPEEHFSW